MKERIKWIIVIVLYYTGISYISFLINISFSKLLVVNYHCTPEKFSHIFEQQLAFFRRYYKNCSDLDLSNINKFKKKLFDKPYLIFSFDDGLRSNYDYSIPLLEKFGFSGWFFVCPTFINSSRIDDLTANRIFPKQRYDDNRYCMDCDELSKLSNRHYIGSHTSNHHRFTVNDSDEIIKLEVIHSKSELSSMLNLKINSFAWVGGEENHYTKAANKMICLNYDFVFTTLVNAKYSNVNFKNIPRTNIESSFSKELFLFQISGILDLIYIFKRTRVNKLLNI